MRDNDKYYNSMQEAINDLLACAYSYDDKPHLLYSCIRRIAEQFEDNKYFQKEIFKLMDLKMSST